MRRVCGSRSSQWLQRQAGRERIGLDGGPGKVCQLSAHFGQRTKIVEQGRVSFVGAPSCELFAGRFPAEQKATRFCRPTEPRAKILSRPDT